MNNTQGVCCEKCSSMDTFTFDSSCANRECECHKSTEKVQLNKGDKIGYWSLIGRSKVPNSVALWECRCRCGNIRNVAAYQLKMGNSGSCGCAVSEKIAKRNTIHGMRNTIFYNKWSVMKGRCRTVLRN